MQKLSAGQFLYFCSMVKEFKQYLTTENLVSDRSRILLAVSGGIDSVVMAELFRAAGLRYGIAHCNFLLRGDNSDGDEAFVSELAQRHRVPFFSKRFETRKAAKKTGASIQMAARELRYRWFHQILETENYDSVATAHHLDDQAETFFINLIRGTGIAGLHGILPVQGKVIHPMMFTDRKNIEKYARENRVKYRKDESNDETKYLRNKIRHEIIPVFREIDPDFVLRLTENISRIREAESVLREAIETKRDQVVRRKGNKAIIPLDKIKQLNPAGLYLHEFLFPYGFNLSQIRDLLNKIDGPSGKVMLSKTNRLIRDRKEILIETLKKNTTQSQQVREVKIEEKRRRLTKPVRMTFTRMKKTPDFELDPSSSIAFLDLHKLKFPLTLRRWKRGDSFFPLGCSFRKKLSDFFIDEKFSLPEKENTWLLCSGDQIIWVAGYRIDNRYRLTTRTKEILKIVHFK